MKRIRVWREFGTGWRMCSMCGARELPCGLIQRPRERCEGCPIAPGPLASRLDVVAAVAASEANYPEDDEDFDAFDEEDIFEALEALDELEAAVLAEEMPLFARVLS